jgi:hypothetical protein
MYRNNEISRNRDHLRVCAPDETRTLGADGVPDVESVAELAGRLARQADDLAAWGEQIERQHAAAIATLTAGLAGMHAVLDALAGSDVLGRLETSAGAEDVSKPSRHAVIPSPRSGVRVGPNRGEDQ